MKFGNILYMGIYLFARQKCKKSLLKRIKFSPHLPALLYYYLIPLSMRGKEWKRRILGIPQKCRKMDFLIFALNVPAARILWFSPFSAKTSEKHGIA